MAQLRLEHTPGLGPHSPALQRGPDLLMMKAHTVLVDEAAPGGCTVEVLRVGSCEAHACVRYRTALGMARGAVATHSARPHRALSQLLSLIAPLLTYNC